MIDVPIQVKDALRDGRMLKNYRFNVLNDDGTTDFTIDNDTLVSESVNIDERMCSGDTIKFGLCEGSSLEFQYFNHVNITGRQIQAFIDIDYGEDEPYSIPMGFFTVKNCSRQASTGIIKATCYNKLQSDYLDAKANLLLESEYENEDYSNSMSLYMLLNKVMEDYTIETRVPQEVSQYHITSSSGWYSSYPFSIFELYDANNQSTNLFLNVAYRYFWNSYYQYPNEYMASAISEDLARKTSNLWEDYIDDLNLEDYKIYADGQYFPLVDFIRTKNYDSLFPSTSAKGVFYWDIKNDSVVQRIDEHIGLMDYYTIEEMTSSFHCNNNMELQIEVPIGMILTGNGPTSYDANTRATVNAMWSQWVTDFNENYNGLLSHDFKKELTPLEKFRVDETIYTIADVTLRELQTAVYESGCQFGQLDRVTDLFSGVELNHSRLLPQDTLYPDTELYPDGATASATKSMYSKLWADEGNIHKWRYLIITYKGLDENNNEADFTLQRTVNADGTDDYNCSDNWLFRNLVWTSSDIGDYADAMVLRMRDIKWFPFEMWCAGLPYLETGDEIEIPLGEQSYTSYVLQRQLKGIQNLQDTYINGTLDIF